MRHPIEELQATLDEMLEYEQVLLLYMAEEGKFGHDFSEHKAAHAELQKAIRCTRLEVLSMKSGEPHPDNKNAQLLDDLDPSFIKADAIERTSRAFEKSMQSLTKCASRVAADSSLLGESCSMQLVANPSKEHREKMSTIADLSKRADLLKASVGLQESQDGDLQTLGDVDESQLSCVELKKSMKMQSTDLEKLTKILTEVETLKDIQGKAEETYSEDHIALDALVASIGENEKTLRDNIAALKSRLESLAK